MSRFSSADDVVEFLDQNKDFDDEEFDQRDGERLFTWDAELAENILGQVWRDERNPFYHSFSGNYHVFSSDGSFEVVSWHRADQVPDFYKSEQFEGEDGYLVNRFSYPVGKMAHYGSVEDLDVERIVGTHSKLHMRDIEDKLGKHDEFERYLVQDDIPEEIEKFYEER